MAMLTSGFLLVFLRPCITMVAKCSVVDLET